MGYASTLLGMVPSNARTGAMYVAVSLAFRETGEVACLPMEFRTRELGA